MELEAFIQESIKQVISSINKCVEFAKENGAEINPYQHQWRHGEGWYFDKQSGRPMTNLEFDVAVTASDGQKTKGGVGISVATLVLGSSGQSESTNQSISRIKFSLPIVLPSTRIPEQK
jgi:hypothetical protein